METMSAIELAKTAYETEMAVNVASPYGDYVLISADEYRDYLDLKETKEVEGNPGLKARLLKSMQQDRSEFISEEEVFADV